MKRNKEILNNFFTYFVRGILLVIPLAATVYIISLGLNWLDGLIKLKIPGLGMLIIIASVTFFGYLGSTLLMKTTFEFTESFIAKLPLINILYSSLKEVLSAFVDKKKKFTTPVLVTLNKAEQIQKMGFITQKDLEELNLPESVAVYLPHSYNFSGELIIVPKSAVNPLTISSTEMMRFILSGGVISLSALKEKTTLND